MKDKITFPLDHFGIVSAPLFAQLLNQSGDKRKRKTAFNSIRTMCKQFGMLPKDAEVETVSLEVDAAGQIAYRVDFVQMGETKNQPIIRPQAPAPRIGHGETDSELCRPGSCDECDILREEARLEASKRMEEQEAERIKRLNPEGNTL